LVDDYHVEQRLARDRWHDSAGWFALNMAISVESSGAIDDGSPSGRERCRTRVESRGSGGADRQKTETRAIAAAVVQ
jgi:hypothetical protein